jgi:Ca-activated chloride channel homolog
MDDPQLIVLIRRAQKGSAAGFAQLLRGGRYIGTWSFEDIIREAQRALGEDPYGYRAEFVQLVRRAQQARGM